MAGSAAVPAAVAQASRLSPGADEDVRGTAGKMPALQRVRCPRYGVLLRAQRFHRIHRGRAP